MGEVMDGHDVKQRFAIAAAGLRHSAPREWNEFLTAVEAYAGLKAIECVQAPPLALPTAQGRAQQAAEFTTMLKDAESTASRILQRRT
jgi:hypothetical protein